MQRSVGFRFSALALTLAVTVFAPGQPAGAQPEPALDTVLAQGNPPLTERIVEQYTELQAWTLEVPVTRELRASQRADLVKSWKDPHDVKVVLDYLKAPAMLAQAEPEDREFYRVGTQQAILAESRSKKNDPAAAFLIAAYEAAHPAIAAGNPPLTDSMVSHYVAFLGWLLEIPATQSFAAAERARLVRIWSNPKEAQNALLMLKWQIEIAGFKYGTPQHDYARALAQPILIKSLRKEGDQESRSLVAAFDAAHRPIADGNPPLTRQASDAWTELYCFVNNQAGYPRMDVTPALKQTFATALGIEYSTYAPERRKIFASMPQRWAALRWTWFASQDADRRKIITAWLPLVDPQQTGDAQLVAAKKAKVRLDAFLLKNPATVSRPEMLQAAADQEVVAAQYQRQGDKTSSANALEMSRTLHTGNPQAYVNLMARWKADGDMLAILKAQYAAKTAMMGAQYISNVYVSGDAAMANVITNINNSPFQTIVVPVVPR